MSLSASRPRSQTMSGGTPFLRPSSCTSPSPTLILSIEMRLDSAVGCLYETQGRWREVQRVSVRYDVDCPEYNTVDGVYRSTPSASSDAASLTPVEMLVRAVDKLLEALPSALIPSIGAISIAAESSLPIFLAASAPSALQSLAPSAQLCSVCTYPSFFSIPFSPNAHDYTAVAEGRRILEGFAGVRVGNSNSSNGNRGEDVMQREERRAAVAQAEEAIAHRTGAGISPGVASMPAQLLKIREGRVVGFAGHERSGLQTAWNRTARVVTPGMLLETLLTGRIPRMHNVDAALTGLCDPRSGRWDACLTDVASGGSGQVLRAMLGEVETFGRHPPATVGSWMGQRFGFRQDCAVYPSLPHAIASFLSFLPSRGDAGLSKSRSDIAVIPSSALVVDRRHIAVPHPLADLDPAAPKWLNLAPLPGAGEARKLVRDGYFHGSWRGYQRLVAALPVGGVASMDNKLFSLYSAYGPLRGLRRYEHGVIVGEFSDLRANARCLVESQGFTLRAAASRIGTADRASNPSAWAPRPDDEVLLKERRSLSPSTLIRDASSLPLRWFVWGGNVCGASAEVLAAISGGCVVACEEEAMGYDDEEEEDQTARGTVGGSDAPTGTGSNASTTQRAALGAAFVALWMFNHRDERMRPTTTTTTTTGFGAAIRRHLDGDASVPTRDEGILSNGLGPGLGLSGIGVDVGGGTLQLQPPRRRPRALTTTAAMMHRRGSLSIVSEQGEGGEGEGAQGGDVTPRARPIEIQVDGDGGGELRIGNGEGERGAEGLLLSVTSPPLLIQVQVESESDVAAGAASPSSAPCDSMAQERLKTDDERRRGLVRLGHADRDLFAVYGALHEEHLRLVESAERAEARAGVGC